MRDPFLLSCVDFPPSTAAGSAGGHHHVPPEQRRAAAGGHHRQVLRVQARDGEAAVGRLRRARALGQDRGEGRSDVGFGHATAFQSCSGPFFCGCHSYSTGVCCSCLGLLRMLFSHCSLMATLSLGCMRTWCYAHMVIRTRTPQEIRCTIQVVHVY